MYRYTKSTSLHNCPFLIFFYNYFSNCFNLIDESFEKNMFWKNYKNMSSFLSNSKIIYVFSNKIKSVTKYFYNNTKDYKILF